MLWRGDWVWSFRAVKALDAPQGLRMQGPVLTWRKLRGSGEGLSGVATVASGPISTLTGGFLNKLATKDPPNFQRPSLRMLWDFGVYP